MTYYTIYNVNYLITNIYIYSLSLKSTMMMTKMMTTVLHQSARTFHYQQTWQVLGAKIPHSHCDKVFSRAYYLRRHQDTCKARKWMI